MRKKLLIPASLFSAFLLLVPVLTSCGNNASLPQSVELTLPSGIVLEARFGSGPASLANTEWRVYRVAPNAQDTPFLTLIFNEEGGISEITDNSIAPQIFGDTILLDGQRHPTTQEGLTYAAAVYGTESDDGSEIAFDLRLRGYVAGVLAATGEASAQAMRIDEDAMEGTFHYKTEVTIVDIPGANQEETLNFRAQRLSQ
jgi:hypothetical protein